MAKAFLYGLGHAGADVMQLSYRHWLSQGGLTG
jgi:hypothetical protein